MLEKYGYGLKDSFGGGALPGMAGGMALSSWQPDLRLRRSCLA